MTYTECLNLLLKPNSHSKYLAIDLYAGCGGLSLGFEAAGFETIAYEKNLHACNTYNSNLQGHCFQSNLNTDTIFPKADILIAGPPCQPFSINGNQNGVNDSRNGFPVCISAIEQISPSVFVLENVKGLLGKNKWYLDYLLEQFQSLGYYLNVKLLNSKDYLVPQNRERIFIIGSKIKKIEFDFKQPFQITSGEALDNLAFNFDENSKFITSDMQIYIDKYELASKCVVPRDLHLHKLSRTLTCRNLAGSTGDMLRISLPNGKRRRLSIKEAAILQSFPDWFKFEGNDSNIFAQIGNAVPPMMAFHVAEHVKKHLDSIITP
jgi:DNA (cytosine-5)-methyltransferase 1